MVFTKSKIIKAPRLSLYHYTKQIIVANHCIGECEAGMFGPFLLENDGEGETVINILGI